MVPSLMRAAGTVTSMKYRDSVTELVVPDAGLENGKKCTMAFSYHSEVFVAL